MMKRPIPTPQARAEKLARYLTQRLKRKDWCKSVNPDDIDMRFKQTCIATTVTGKEGFAEACEVLRIPVGSDLAKELGLETYSSYATDREAWERESADLTSAMKAVVRGRQVNYRHPRPRFKIQKRSKRKLWISPTG